MDILNRDLSARTNVPEDGSKILEWEVVEGYIHINSPTIYIGYCDPLAVLRYISINALLDGVDIWMAWR
jgi:hypothetical protein